MKKKQKYYVVFVGRIPGIYVDWAEAKRQTVKFYGARVKSFTDLEEAEAALKLGWRHFYKNDKLVASFERKNFVKPEKDPLNNNVIPIF